MFKFFDAKICNKKQNQWYFQDQNIHLRWAEQNFSIFMRKAEKVKNKLPAIRSCDPCDLSFNAIPLEQPESRCWIFCFAPLWLNKMSKQKRIETKKNGEAHFRIFFHSKTILEQLENLSLL